MSCRHVLCVVLASALLAPPAAFAAVTVWTEVAVRVYDTTGESADERQAALDVARSILSAAAIEVVWGGCDRQVKGQRGKGKGKGQGEGQGTTCESPLRRGELAVRIVRPPAPVAYRGDLPLGDALIDTRARAGVLATIYFDRVAWLARQTGADRRTLLGRAIAHEIGHLLLASSAHGTHGLMRAVWSREELRDDRASDWTFGQVEIAALNARSLPR